MHWIFENLVNGIYPRHCPICHNILKNQKSLVCEECIPRIHPLQGALCKKCGRPVDKEQEYCRECGKYHHVFDEGRGIFLYDSLWKNSLMKYKYFGCREYADFYAELICMAAEKEIRRWNPDMIAFVPLHKHKERTRGFNQSQLLAEKISRKTKIPIVTDLVIKKHKTKSQKKLNAQERRQNLQKAFYVKYKVTGKRILIVDDVFTTGSTMDAMASVLKKQGAEKIYFITLCLGLH